MFPRVRLLHIFTFAFYVILLGICIKAWIKLMREPTAYEETIVENEAILPSFTLCPLNHHDSVVKSIENFNDVTQAIENTKFKYIITITNKTEKTFSPSCRTMLQKWDTE